LPSQLIAAKDERLRRFEEVYTAHHGAVFGYVLRRTSNPEDAADVIAETFLTAWRRVDDVPPGPRARLWLYGVARRVLANYRRGERRRTALADRLRADFALSYHLPDYGGDQARIAAAFRRLPGPDQELLTLSAWENLDNGQIAIVLGCSRNAVRIRVHRARKRFADELAQCQVRPAEPGTNVRNGELA
jgi:RNA polymerase sigma-70 factor, ECF subfamily